MKNKTVLIIFAKYPETGKVKTRLGKDIGNKKAMLLYIAMLKDTIQNTYKNRNYDVALGFTPDNKSKKFEELLGIKIMHPQGKGSLGNKMLTSFKHFLGKYDKAIIIGSDLPTINSKLIKKAFESLNNKEIVLGESADGGYYLIGVKKIHNIFSGFKWSTKHVLKDTLNKIKKENLSYFIMPKMEDIDKVSDLNELKKEISSERCPNTHRFLESYSFKNKLK